jgi:hypothetical protein
MIYLLDANVLITAHNSYYPVDGVPEFWAWLIHQGSNGIVKMPQENFEEVRDGSTSEEDLLCAWIKSEEFQSNILLDEEVDSALVDRVVSEGYAPDLTDQEIAQIGRDPFLIAYALVSPAERSVVTAEVSRPSRVRQNRHIPDVCATMGVTCYHTFGMTKLLGFKTGWSSP